MQYSKQLHGAAPCAVEQVGVEFDVDEKDASLAKEARRTLQRFRLTALQVELEEKDRETMGRELMVKRGGLDSHTLRRFAQAALLHILEAKAGESHVIRQSLAFELRTRAEAFQHSPRMNATLWSSFEANGCPARPLFQPLDSVIRIIRSATIYDQCVRGQCIESTRAARSSTEKLTAKPVIGQPVQHLDAADTCQGQVAQRC